MARPTLEVADIFRDHGPAWREANAGHVSLDQLKVMSAIERCRTAALGGHVERCEDCAYTTIAFNTCLMGKFRNGELGAAEWEIGSVFMWLRVDRTAVCSPLRRCPRESCLQSRALRYTRYSEGHFVDRTRDPTKISMCRGFDPIEPIAPPDPRNGPF